MIRKIIKLFVAIMFAIVLVGCQSQKPEQIAKGKRIVTSFFPVYAMTKMVSGDLNEVKMIQSGAGIHGFEPSPTDVAAIYNADVFIYHSKVLESWAADLANQADTNNHQVHFLEASKDLPLDRVEGLEDVPVIEGVDEKSLYDPHTWTDPILVGKETQAIADYLSEIDPDHQKTYQENAKKVIKQTEELTEKYQKKFAEVSQREFVTQHTAFSYLAKRFGLSQIGIAGVSEEEPNTRQLAEIVDFVKTYKVKTIFTESSVSPKLAKVVADATGAKIKTLSPLEADPKDDQSYLEHLETNLAILYRELH